MAKFGFDSSEVDVNATGTFDPIPAGEYTLKALEAEEKQTKSGGTMIKVKFQVVGGDFDGRLIWNNFNIVNASEKAQNIGRQQLVAWATAAGKPDADDTDKLIDRKFKAMVSIEKGTGGYADSNGIKSYLFTDEASAAKPAKPSTPAKPAAPVKPRSSKNPWDD
jgi:hypothetical protein